jgi:hypothetical protein
LPRPPCVDGALNIIKDDSESFDPDGAAVDFDQLFDDGQAYNLCMIAANDFRLVLPPRSKANISFG